MLDEGCAHILATDAHDVSRRPPNLGQGRDLAAKRVGDKEAYQMVVMRPRGVLANTAPSNLAMPMPAGADSRTREVAGGADGTADEGQKEVVSQHSNLHGIVKRLRFWGAGRGS